MLFFLPCVFVLSIELFVLPIDFFTFRVWEALVVREFRNLLPGRFYPNMKITKEEEGDLAHHTRFAVKKKVKWITDQYGYRKHNPLNRHSHRIVIVGGSNIAGSTLTQEEILSEVLEDQLKISVYPYAPVGSINSFLKDRRIMENPPEIVIFGRVERELLDLSVLKPPKKRGWPYKIKEGIQNNRMIQSFAVLLDRLSKMTLLHYFRAALRRSISDSPMKNFKGVASEYGPIFFLQGAAANQNVPKDKFDRAVDIIKSYNDILNSKGIRFIFLPIPEKENIFHEYLNTKKPVFLKHLIFSLREMGIEVVDTQKGFEEGFEEAFNDNVLLYQTDDTHWNANGVRVAADLIKNVIVERE
jgi:hypothetical protein